MNEYQLINTLKVHGFEISKKADEYNCSYLKVFFSIISLNNDIWILKLTRQSGIFLLALSTIQFRPNRIVFLLKTGCRYKITYKDGKITYYDDNGNQTKLPNNMVL